MVPFLTRGVEWLLSAPCWRTLQGQSGIHIGHDHVALWWPGTHSSREYTDHPRWAIDRVISSTILSTLWSTQPTSINAVTHSVEFLPKNSMRWFFHRHSRVTSCLLWRVNADRIVCCCLLRTAYIRLTRNYALSMEMTQQFFGFVCPWWPWHLNFDVDIRTRAKFLYSPPTATFHRPTFNRSEVIVRTNKLTNKQTDAAENIHLASLRHVAG